MIGSVGEVYKIEELDINFAIKNIGFYKNKIKKEYKNFIYTYLISCYMKQYLTSRKVGSIQKFLGLGELRDMPIIVNDELIKKYEEVTNPLFLKLDQIKIENKQLSEMRNFLLPMLMNRQVTVS